MDGPPGFAARSVAPADLRRHNLSLVVRHVRSHGPCARSEIAAATGLVRGSVTGLVGVLLSQGWLREVPGPPGRPTRSALVELDGAGLAVLALHVDGDGVRCRASDVAGRVLLWAQRGHRAAHPRPAAVADAASELVRRACADLAARGTAVARVVVVVSAPVTGTPPRVPVSIDLGWREVPLLELLAERLPGLDVPLSLINDANAAVLAEFGELRARPGAAGAPPLTDVVLLKSDTGVGGAWITGSRLVTGSRGAAFEPGHVVVDPAGAPCSCGQRGCLAVVAGPHAVLRDGGLDALRRTAGARAALEELLVRADAGRARPVRALRRAGVAIGRVVATLVVLTDPQHVVLGGYWARALPHLRPGVEEALAALTLPDGGTARPAAGLVVAGTAGDDAALRGASCWALEELLDDPVGAARRAEQQFKP
ncbi:ROK family transcriptional regulator [Kineococcus sp. G2]|uniref:ROK family transcriptional regulator n=1 Tax=Kineococcus sp. G2 TaxID=3127484 RepID=UPI00301BBD13